MTMWPRPSHAVPAITAQVARAAFPKGCLAIRIRDALDGVFEDAQFAGPFATRGRPAVSPARLARCQCCTGSGVPDQAAAGGRAGPGGSPGRHRVPGGGGRLLLWRQPGFTQA